LKFWCFKFKFWLWGCQHKFLAAHPTSELRQESSRLLPRLSSTKRFWFRLNCKLQHLKLNKFILSFNNSCKANPTNIVILSNIELLPPYFLFQSRFCIQNFLLFYTNFSLRDHIEDIIY
jgi:hypothetical protein